MDVLIARLSALNVDDASGIVAPASMQAVWDWEHELMVDKTAKIRALLDMYKR